MSESTGLLIWIGVVILLCGVGAAMSFLYWRGHSSGFDKGARHAYYDGFRAGLDVAKAVNDLAAEDRAARPRGDIWN